ncbi:MAG: ABC-type branched-subunit amino acid transport system substrate-binding protein [Planctomycetota bacterium]|jgi:ABC-type branched-subunit amino acid transport system substrate-binding protein
MHCSARLLFLSILLVASVLAVRGQAQVHTVVYSVAAEKTFTSGLEAYRTGDYETARDAFLQLLEFTANQRSSAGQLMLGKSYFHLLDYEAALDASRGLQRKYANSRYGADARLLAGDAYIKLKRYYEAATQYGRLLATPAPLLTQAQAAERLAAIDKNGYISTKALESVRLSVGAKRMREALFYGRARWFRRLGWLPEAEAATQTYRDSIGEAGIFASLLETPFDFNSAAAVAEPVQPVFTVEPVSPIRVISEMDERVKLGLLLPLSGPYHSIADELYSGMQMANEDAGDLFQLIVADTGIDYGELPIKENPGSSLLRVADGARSLVDQGVTAIIGPIFSSSGVVAAVVAEAAGVPLVAPLSQQSGLDSLGQYIFQLNTIPETQGRLLGEYSTLVLGQENLVVIAPLSDYGWNFEREFKRVAEANGGHVVHSDWYVPNETKDFRRVFEEIRRIGFELMPEPEDTLAAADSLEWVGRDSTSTPPSFLSELLQGLEEEDEEEVVEEEEAPPDSSEIFIDTIDGIVVLVESFADAKTIAPQIHFYRLQTQVMGNDIWYDPEGLRQMRPGERKYVDETILVSAHREGQQVAQTFVDAYRSRFYGDPKYAAYGYDAVTLIVEAWRQGGGDGVQMRDWLAQVRTFSGASGGISFDEGRHSNVDLTLLKIDKDRFRPLEVGDLPDLSNTSGDLPIPELDLPVGEVSE